MPRFHILRKSCWKFNNLPITVYKIYFLIHPQYAGRNRDKVWKKLVKTLEFLNYLVSYNNIALRESETIC